MKDLKFSLVSPAIRTENWIKVYNSILSKNSNFELIFAGPREPNYNLPENLKFIKTNVKPAQCWEILYENSKGEYIMNIGDDLMFRTENPLDVLSEELESNKNNKYLLGLRYKFRGKEQTKDLTFKIDDNLKTDLLPLSPPLKKDLWHKYGRFDSRFICTLMEADFFLRMINDGYKVINSSVIVTEDKEFEDIRKMSRDYMRIDHKLMLKLWTKNDNGNIAFSKKRNEPVKNFEKDNIMFKSEKPYGRWSNNSKLYNFIITSKIFYRINLYYFVRQLLYKIKVSFSDNK